MSPRNLLGGYVLLFVASVLGCDRSSVEAARETPERTPVVENALDPSETSAVADDPWRGLERHEIQLDQKLLIVKGSKGVIGCPYLNVDSFERFGEACAIIPAVDTAGMLDSKVTAVTPKAKSLGIEVGMPGREALEKIR